MNKSRSNEDFSLEALRAGDRAEFARLVEAYYEMIYRLAIKMLNNPQDAEDIKAVISRHPNLDKERVLSVVREFADALESEEIYENIRTLLR